MQQSPIKPFNIALTKAFALCKVNGFENVPPPEVFREIKALVEEAGSLVEDAEQRKFLTVTFPAMIEIFYEQATSGKLTDELKVEFLSIIGTYLFIRYKYVFDTV